MSLTIVFWNHAYRIFIGIQWPFNEYGCIFPILIILSSQYDGPLRMVVGAESYELNGGPPYMLAAHIMNSMGLTMRIFSLQRHW